MPCAWSISTSLKPMSDFFSVKPNLIPSEVRWENYRDVFDNAPFLRFYVNSIVVTMGRTVGQVAIASLAAFRFSQLRFLGRDLIFFVLLQVPKQAGLSASMASGGSLLGGRGVEGGLVRITSVLGGFFMLLALLINLVSR